MKKTEKVSIEFRRFADAYWPIIVVLALLVIMLVGCSGTKDIPVVHDTIYKTNTEYVNKVIVDSIYVKDSMWVEVNGDTIWIDRWHTEYVYRERVDTLMSVDTIYKSKEIPVPVEKIKKVYLWWPSLLILIAAAAGVYYYKRLRH